MKFNPPVLHHAQSELYAQTRKLETGNAVLIHAAKSFDPSKNSEEWLAKSKFIEKADYYKVFGKYWQVKEFQLTNIYDPPLTMKEIKKLRKEKRKQYKLKMQSKKKVGVSP